MALTFLQSAPSTADAAVYTFSAQNLGPASGDRYIIVAVGSRVAGLGALTVDSVTVAGQPATSVLQRVNEATNRNIAALFLAAVPSGTSGDVVVTFSATMLRAGIALYAVTELSSPTPHDSDSAITADPSVALDIPANGFAVATYNSSGGLVVWTGLTEDYDFAIEVTFEMSGASGEFVEAQSGLTITADGSGSNPVGVFASWAFGAAPSIAIPIGTLNNPISM